MAGRSSMPPPSVRAAKPAANRPRRRPERCRFISSRIRTEILPCAIFPKLLYPDDDVLRTYSPPESSNPPADVGVKNGQADRAVAQERDATAANPYVTLPS